MDITLQQAWDDIDYGGRVTTQCEAIDKLCEILGDKATYNTETGEWNISIADASKERKVHIGYVNFNCD